MRDDLQGFLYALERLKLMEILDTSGPFTILAAQDDAFKKIPDRLFDELMDSEVLDLALVIDNHIYHGYIDSDSLRSTNSLMTTNGRTNAVQVIGDTINIAGVNVIEPDIACSNGVIHIVDGLILPEEVKSVLQLDEIREGPRERY